MWFLNLSLIETDFRQNWSYRAKNSTLRAIRKAGFNETTFPRIESIILVTEPEAAAIYTARHLKEDKEIEFLEACNFDYYLTLVVNVCCICAPELALTYDSWGSVLYYAMLVVAQWSV